MQFDRPVFRHQCWTLGFVAGLETDELDRLKNLIEGKFILDERMVLKAELTVTGFSGQYYALNDAVIARGALSRILDLEVLFSTRPSSAITARMALSFLRRQALRLTPVRGGRLSIPA